MSKSMVKSQKPGLDKNKRYQVFVSSTYVDLENERQEVIQSLLRMNCIPCGMELFPAASDDAWSLIKRIIDECDYYVLVVGGRYGSTDSRGISYTEKEYVYAMKRNKPIVAFLHADPGKIIFEKSEAEQSARRKLQRFRKRIQKEHHVSHWKSPEELGARVSQSLHDMIRNKPAIGWIRCDDAGIRHAIKECESLRKRLREYEAARKVHDRSSRNAGESLAQGRDKVALHWGYWSPKSHRYCRRRLSLSWDEVFLSLVQSLGYGRAYHREETIRRALEDMLRKRFELCNKPVGAIMYMRLEDPEFRIVARQMIGLGMVEIDAKKEISPLWRLTAQGERYYATLVAQKRQ